MKRLRSLSRPPAFVPTTSMADIAFLLIIFFMLSAEFSVRKGLVFNLPPDPSTGPSPEALQPVILGLDPGGRLEIDGSPADLTDIKRVIVPKLEASPNQWILIRADGETPYARVIEVLDQIKQLGAKNIAIPTRAEFEAWEQQKSKPAQPKPPEKGRSP